MENHKLSGGSLPLSPQLCLSLRQQKQPRTSVHLSRSSSPSSPPPITLESTYDRYILVPSGMRDAVSTGGSYISRTKLLHKMYQRRAHIRSFVSNDAEDKNINVEDLVTGIEILGPPVDYWFSFPLKINLECKILPLKEESEEVNSQDEEHVLARRCEVASSREMLNRDVGVGLLPAVERLAFPWVKNASATKFLSLKDLDDYYDGIRIDGFVECIKCGKINGIGFLLPTRFQVVKDHILGDFDDVQRLLSTTISSCHCEGISNPIPMLPIISENHTRINWLFLFYGMGLEHCTQQQLSYFCEQRKITLIGNSDKKTLLRHVCVDVFGQVLLPEHFS